MAQKLWLVPRARITEYMNIWWVSIQAFITDIYRLTTCHFDNVAIQQYNSLRIILPVFVFFRNSISATISCWSQSRPMDNPWIPYSTASYAPTSLASAYYISSSQTNKSDLSPSTVHSPTNSPDPPTTIQWWWIPGNAPRTAAPNPTDWTTSSSLPCPIRSAPHYCPLINTVRVWSSS